MPSVGVLHTVLIASHKTPYGIYPFYLFPSIVQKGKQNLREGKLPKAVMLISGMILTFRKLHVRFHVYCQNLLPAGWSIVLVLREFSFG